MVLLSRQSPASSQTLTCNGLTVTVDVGLGQSPTEGADVILGTSGDDVIDARAGDDVVCARGGDDLVIGGLGDDLVFGGGGADRLAGNAGDDDLRGEGGKDIAYGGSGADVVDGGDGDDLALGGGSGIDVVTGGPGGDRISGGSDADSLVDGGPGADFVNGGGGSDPDVRGGQGDDSVSGNGGRDVVHGDEGDDQVRGGDGDDRAYGGTGDDRLWGGKGDDICDGGPHVNGDIVDANCETVIGGHDDACASVAAIPNRAGGYTSGDEDSGLVASATYDGVYWYIRDAGSGDREKLYAIRIDPSTGQLDPAFGTKEISVTGTGVVNVDWEALAADDYGNLWIGDIGTWYDGAQHDRNNNAELDVQVIRVPEPDPYSDTTVATTKVSPFLFPGGGTLNAEAMFFVDDWLFLITKDLTPAKVYRFPTYISRDQSANVLRYVGELQQSDLDPITDGTISADNSRLALTTASRRVVVYEHPPATATSSASAETVMEDLVVTGVPDWHYYYRRDGARAADGIPGTGQETMQVEGAAWRTGGTDLVMISEFGKHVLNAPRTSSLPCSGWRQRPGAGSS